jgi:alpha-galactosidase
MRSELSLCLLFCSLCAVAGGLPVRPAGPPKPTEDEMARCRRWAQEQFRRVRRAAVETSVHPRSPRAGLLVIANHGPILFNGRPDGRPIQIGDAAYRRGLICHANSKVVVQLPAPGKTFTSFVGVDANAGGGTAVFSVKVGGRETFRSDVMRGGQSQARVSVALGGADRFTIEAGDAGDGIACDHADWAEAEVTLEDGHEVWLSDLPVLSSEPPERGATATLPFSFLYGGDCSDNLLGGWKFKETRQKLDARRTRRIQTYLDPKTGLELRCELVQYEDFPTVEWTLYLKNTGAADTPLIENIQALDTRLKRAKEGEFVLHRSVGSPTQENDYQPLEATLSPNARRRVTGAGGRPTGSDLCYFNLRWPDEGLIVALGWPGQWAANFQRDTDAGLRVTAGQELTRLKLHPGEEIRTPLVALQFTRSGDWVRAQNLWRRWMLAHNMPRPDGKPVLPHYGGCFGNIQPRAGEEIEQIDGLLRNGVKLDYWFIDAGWYPNDGSWVNVGTWEPDKTRFPHGLREVADHLHAKGVKFIVWFEPERVAAGTWLAQNHPEWVLGGRNGGLLNMGDPAARAWITDRVDRILSEEGIDVYRSDFNLDPLPFWQANDAEDRQGITENAYVTGFLAFWDELLRRHPGMFIDTCASGGRRNDLETLRRSVPLLRSDWAVLRFNTAGAIGQQCQTYGISFWIPYHGTGAPAGDSYTMLSSFCPAYRIGWDVRDEKRDRALLRQTVDTFRRVENYLLGDFYPLTPYSLAKTDWIAWQYDRPESGEGVVQAFRREECMDDSRRFVLRGLDAGSAYVVTDLEGGESQQISGRQLMKEGLMVRVPGRPGAAVFVYKRAL